MNEIEERNRERRDREVERSGWRKLTPVFASKVVGVSYVDAHPDNLLALRDAADQAADLGEKLTAVLVRQPENRYDPNAIEVHVPALGDEFAMVGHLTRPIAARLAPELDDGARWQAEIEDVLIHPDHTDRPGISIVCRRIEGDS